jgi:hypothetical protein
MVDLSDGAIATEEAPIKSAYYKRRDGSLYSWSNQGYLFHVQELERRVWAMLRAQDLYSLNNTKILEICEYGFKMDWNAEKSMCVCGKRFIKGPIGLSKVSGRSLQGVPLQK